MVTQVRPASTEVTARVGPRRLGFLDGALLVASFATAFLIPRDASVAWQTSSPIVAVSAVAILAFMLSANERWRGRAAAGVGALMVALSMGFLPYLLKDGSATDFVAVGSLALAAVVLLVGGTAVATQGRGTARRLGAGVLVVVGAAVLSFVFGPAVAATHVPRPAIGATPASINLSYEDITVVSRDGVRLAAWYVPSANGAAVVLLHGAGSTRSDVLDEAGVLAANGFGVLMLDARGHGESGGQAMDFGWAGDADITAATDYLTQRPDVDSDGIGLVGMSMGGEEAIGATYFNGTIRAVVAEGATSRNASDENWLSEQYGFRGQLQEQLEAAQDWATGLFTSARNPVSLHDAAAHSAAHYMLITAGGMPDEANAAWYIETAAPDRVEIWTVAHAGHIGGLRTAPDEWESRVIGFLNHQLIGEE